MLVELCGLFRVKKTMLCCVVSKAPRLLRCGFLDGSTAALKMRERRTHSKHIPARTCSTKARSTETMCVKDLTIPKMYCAGTEEDMSTSICVAVDWGSSVGEMCWWGWREGDREGDGAQ